MEDFSVCFQIFGYSIKWYSVCILVGVLLAYSVINSECKRLHINKDFIINMLFWVLIIGILGARIYYVLFNLDYYMQNLSEIYKIWNGGLAIHGGIIAGILVIICYCKKYRVNIIRIIDVLAPGLLIAQAIGRWGNFFNQEAYGLITSYNSLVDMKIIPQFVIDNMLINGSYRLPMFYFESLACIVSFLLIVIIRKGKYIKYGVPTSLYLILYGITRFVIEGFRTDSLMLGEFKVARIVSIIFIIIGIIIILVVNGKPKLEGLYNENMDEIDY